MGVAEHGRVEKNLTLPYFRPNKYNRNGLFNGKIAMEENAMVNFRWLSARQCDWCSELFIPFDPEFPGSTVSTCSKKCRRKLRMVSKQVKAGFESASGHNAKYKPKKKHKKLRGQHYLDTHKRP